MNLDKIIAVRTTKTVYRDGDTAIKVFSEDYLKTDVLNEALNQARVIVGFIATINWTYLLTSAKICKQLQN